LIFEKKSPNIKEVLILGVEMKIIDALKEIKDERKYNGKEYQLWQIILLVTR
jgi:hypothetical protein